MKHKLTPAFVATPPMPPFGRDRITYWEGGFGLMVTANGHKSFVVQYRAGKQSRRLSLKAGLSLLEARREAKAILGAVAKGGDPLSEKRKAETAAANTLKAISEEFFRREGSKLRSRKRREKALERLVYPKLGNRPIESIKRSEIVRLLDEIEEENGPHQAQAILTFLSRLLNWHASRDDDFMPPIRRGMGRTKLKEYARKRVLSDDELRAVWRAAEAFPGVYGNLVRFLLLTAARRGEAAKMKRQELAGTDWIIPPGRMKGNEEHLIPLPKTALVLLKIPNIGDFMFSLDGRKPNNNFAAHKAKLDKMSGVTGWRLHDLRRTARSLMSRAGVAPDIAERCLAHKVGGIRGIYDRHAYYEEKKHAFEALAGLVERIVEPASNVVAIRQ